MNEFDFSQLQSLRTPDDWIETALHIPQQRRKPFLLFRPSVIGTAASLVIIAAVVLTLALHAGSSLPPQPPHVMVAEPSAETTAATAAAVQPASAATVAATQAAATATETVVPAVTAADNGRSSTSAAADTTAAADTLPTTGTDSPTGAAAPVTEPSTQTTTAAVQPPATPPQTIPTVSTTTSTMVPASEWFQGNIALLIPPTGAFYGNERTYVRFESSLGLSGEVCVAQEPAGELSYENLAEFCPYDCNVFVPCGEPCTVTVYDDFGNRQVFHLVFPLAGTIYLKT